MPSLVNIESPKEEEEIAKLCVYLTVVASNCKDRAECLRELAESEFIPEEMFERFVVNEKIALLNEIQDYINLFKGWN